MFTRHVGNRHRNSCRHEAQAQTLAARVFDLLTCELLDTKGSGVGRVPSSTHVELLPSYGSFSGSSVWIAPTLEARIRVAAMSRS